MSQETLMLMSQETQAEKGLLVGPTAADPYPHTPPATYLNTLSHLSA